MTNRIDQVNALLGVELGRLMHRVQPPKTVATVTAVETSPDLRHASVWVSLIPDSDEAWTLLTEQLPELQAGLAARIELKHTPKLRLRRDHGGEAADTIGKLLENGR